MTKVSFDKYHTVYCIPNRFDKNNFLLNEPFSYLEKTKEEKKIYKNNITTKKILFLLLFSSPLFISYFLN